MEVVQEMRDLTVKQRLEMLKSEVASLQEQAKDLWAKAGRATFHLDNIKAQIKLKLPEDMQGLLHQMDFHREQVNVSHAKLMELDQQGSILQQQIEVLEQELESESSESE